jgi:hypothetical protein
MRKRKKIRKKIQKKKKNEKIEKKIEKKKKKKKKKKIQKIQKNKNMMNNVLIVYFNKISNINDNEIKDKKK